MRAINGKSAEERGGPLPGGGFRANLAPPRESAVELWWQRCNELAAMLDAGQGVRVGDTAVVSRRVHTIVPDRPGEVQVVSKADAGQVFYGRKHRNEVVHVDLFHDLGDLDPGRVAIAIAHAVAWYQGDIEGHYCGGEGSVDMGPGHRESGGFSVASQLNLTDVQTALGGGRVTGDLSRGRTQTLRNSHRNHVHLTFVLEPVHTPLIFYMVHACEEVVVQSGLDLRSINEVVVEAGEGDGRLDLSKYRSNSDSHIREVQQAEGEIQDGSRGEPSREPSLSDDTADLQSEPAEERDEFEEGASHGLWGRSDALSLALDLAQSQGGIESLSELMNSIEEAGPWEELKLSSRAKLRRSISELEKRGLVERRWGQVHFTDKGKRFSDFVRTYCRELEAKLRQMVRKLPGPTHLRDGSDSQSHQDYRRSSSRRRIVDLGSTANSGDLAVPETITAAIKRSFLEDDTKGTLKWRVSRRDLKVFDRRMPEPVNLCLVLDASASMAGKRLEAARYLAAHLLLSTRDRVSVIIFQEDSSKVYVPFTRDYPEAERRLNAIKPLGLTPLAHGITTALDYVLKVRARNPLIVLITDGIPTVPKWSTNPMEDARQAARQLRQHRVRTAIIGLEPNRRYLDQLASNCKGTLYVVDELESRAMVDIVEKERQKLSLR